MKIICYKCVDTNQIFEDYNEYRRHRRRYLYEQKQLARTYQLSSQKSEVISDLLLINRLGQLSDHIIKHWSYYWHNGYRHHNPWIRKYPKVVVPESIKISNVRYSNEISNRDVAPINGKTNWFRSSDLPLSYPGWVFDMEVVGVNERRYFEYMPIHRHSHYRTEYVLFADDFPLLLENQIVVDNWRQLGSEVIDIM